MKDLERLISKTYNMDGESRDKFLNDFIMQNYKDFKIGEKTYLDDTSVLVKISLENDYDYTIRTLIKNDGISSYNGVTHLMQALQNYFILNEESTSLIKVYPRLLQYSFKNDFKTTLRALTSYCGSNLVEKETIEVEMYRYEKYILEAMKNNNYVLDENYDTLQEHMFDIENVINMSFKNDPIATVKKLLEFSFKDPSKSYLYSINVAYVLKQDPNFFFDRNSYTRIKNFVSKEDMNNLIKISLKNKEYQTLLNGFALGSEFMDKDFDEEKEDAIVELLIRNQRKFRREYSTSVSINNLINRHPNVVVKLLQKDYACGVKLLGIANVGEIKEDAFKEIKSELVKNNYVVSYVNNNIYMLKRMFLESLKVDFNKTMLRIKEVFSDEFYSSKLTQHGEILVDIIVDNLSSHECKGIDSICKFIIHNPEILIKAMRKNPKMTIENLSKASEPFNLGDIGELYQKELLDILVENHFSIANGKNVTLIQLNSAFLLASLRCDYDGTKEKLAHSKTVVSTVNYSDEYYEEIVNITKEHNDKETHLRACSRNVNLLKYLMKSNLNLAYEAVDYLENPVPLKRKEAQDLLSELKKASFDNVVDYDNHHNLTALLSWGIFNDRVKDSEITDMLDCGFPISFLPLTTKEKISKYLTSAEQEMYDKLYFNSQSYEYSFEDEEKLLKMLGSDFDCIEDELTLLHQKGYKKSDLNLKQLLLFALYMKKDHKNKGLEGYKLNLFEYANHNLTLGVHKDEIKEICIYNGHDSSIAEMLKTIAHENNHAKQSKSVRSCDVVEDEDIMVYSKDALIRSITRDLYQLDFYDDNYWTIAAEYDAELKAQLEIAKLLRIDIEDESLKTHVEIDGYNKAYLNFGLDHNKYELTGKRDLDGEVSYIDEIFDMLIHEAIENGTIKISYLVNKYPIICYEYNIIKKPIEKRTIEQLVEQYLRCPNAAKEVIKTILKHRINPLYQDDYKENIKELEDIINKNNIDDDSLKLLVQEALVMTDKVKEEIDDSLTSLGKYFKIIENLSLGNNRISNEKFIKISQKRGG